MSSNSFGTKSTLKVDNKDYTYFSLPKLGDAKKLARLPVSLRVLLENLLRNEDGGSVKKDDIEAILNWDPKATPSKEIAYRPARVVLQDFTGVPCVVDLAAMREAFKNMGGDASRINPLQPVDLVIDHSVQVDQYGNAEAFENNVRIEYQRNKERYAFLRWGQSAFSNFRAVPPGTGIVHQVNLEYLASVVFSREIDGEQYAYPDTVVGTDSHTTMINGTGVLGWGVGGIEAEAAMLGQPVSMLIPQVVGFKLTGKLPEGATATDLVLTVVEMLRGLGVVGKFVEFFGPGLDALSLADRATLANMAPEYGATMGFFPVDNETLNYLRLTGRDDHQVNLVESYLKEQGLFREAGMADPEFSDVLELDMAKVEPSISGPKRPQDRIALSKAKTSWGSALNTIREAAGGTATAVAPAKVKLGQNEFELSDGDVVIAAITSCTNTSNPAVMIAAGLVAQKAQALGLKPKPWVKTSLAPGSKVVMDYFDAAGLTKPLADIGFNLVGFGCTTCIGNSGPLAEPIASAVEQNDLVVTSVLSGNRNFEGRISPHVRANYLASPPLVVAYALAGTMNIDIAKDPIAQTADGKDVFLKDVWPSNQEVSQAMNASVKPEMFRKRYDAVFEGDKAWRDLPVPTGDLFEWEEESTYVRNPPFFEGMGATPDPLSDIEGARVLALLGDSVTTDHISPAGAIKADSPAGKYLQEHGVAPQDFNSYGSRRGNHEVMMRGTFANIRIKNQLVPGVEGGVTRHLPDGEQMSIYDAAMKYQAEKTPLVVLAGGLYGNGSSRDWAAKGTVLLGVKAVVAKSFERIHRSNLIGMGVLPLEFTNGQDAASLGLTGEEVYDIFGIAEGLKPGATLKARARQGDGSGSVKEFEVKVRIDTPEELSYYKHGGILQYVLRSLKQG